MNVALFLTDELQAARECLAVAGNAHLQSAALRRDELDRFVAILAAHRLTMEQAVLPAVRAHGAMTPDVQAAWADLCAVVDAAASLAAGQEGAASPAPGDLAARFEAMVARQEMAVIPAIRALPSDTLEALTDRVRSVRLGRTDAG